MPKSSACALVLVLGLSSAAFGDGAPSAPPPVQSTTNIDPATLAAARDLLEANEVTAYNEAVQEEMLASRDQLIDMYAGIYAEHFTADEMHRLADFYRSDVGRKYISTIPQMMKEVMPLAMEYGKDLIPRVRARVNAQLGKKSEPK